MPGCLQLPVGMPQPESSKYSSPLIPSQCSKGIWGGHDQRNDSNLRNRGDPVLAQSLWAAAAIVGAHQAVHQKHPRSLIEAASPQLTTTPTHTLRVHVDLTCPEGGSTTGQGRQRLGAVTGRGKGGFAPKAASGAE